MTKSKSKLIIVPYHKLSTSNLNIDCIYEGGSDGRTTDDPISRLLSGVGNQGGFRASGRGNEKKFVVLYTSGEDNDWPDRLNLNTGQFVYYGDNKTPGQRLHNTGPGGNRILRRVFNLLHAPNPLRLDIPPFFIFKKYPTSNSTRSVQFVGLAVPGYAALPAEEDLVAVWRTTRGLRFQNYRAVFTVLNASPICRTWLEDLRNGQPMSDNAPDEWRTWVERGRYLPLMSRPTTNIRSVDDQIPRTEVAIDILEAIYEHFRVTPISFEKFAARLFQMHDNRMNIDEITRGAVDGGRDAVGHCHLGLDDDPVQVEFSLEAKCNRPPIREYRGYSVGVAGVSRLISRIRNRQFGVLVTTSVIARQAYKEVRDDRHPIIFICGKDITDILISNGYGSRDLVVNLLNNDFPV